MKDEELLKRMRERFKRSADKEADNREDALDDIRFARLAEQWPAEVRRQRELEGRPCLTINRLPSFIRQVVNDSRMNKPSIKVHPVDSGSDVDTAEVLNGLIRNIEVSSNADVAFDTALDFAVTGGFGYFRINTKYAYEDTFDMDITIERISNPFSVYGDADSVAYDSSDWRYCFVIETMNKDDFEAKYKSDPISWTEYAVGDTDDWITEDSVRVAEYWEREEVDKEIVLLADGSVWSADDYEERRDMFETAGLVEVNRRTTKGYKVTQYISNGVEILDTVEWAGCYIPIVPVYGEEINIDGKRCFRGLVRDAKDPQRMFNYWRTTATELVALAPKTPFIGPKGAFVTDGAKWATANVQSHPFIEYDGAVPPQRQPFAGVPAGALQEALNAADDMKAIMGIYDASLGARSNETSGRAIIARQREGDISTFHFIDNLARSIRHAGRILVDLIPKVYSTPRVIRILGEDMGNQSVPVNQPVIVQGAEKIFDLTNGKYDVTVTTGPSFTTQREEAAANMIEFIRAYPLAAPLLGDLLAKNMDWPQADEIAKRMQAMLPPQIQGDQQIPPQIQAQMQQMGEQLQMAGQQVQQLQAQLHQAEMQKIEKSADVQMTQIDAQVKLAELQVKQKELEIKQQELILKQQEIGLKSQELEVKKFEAASGAMNQALGEVMEEPEE